MIKTSINQLHIILAAGDILVLGLVTLYGFASHNLVETAGSRMLTTFIPLVVSWLLVSPHLQVFDLQRVARPVELWRPFWAMILAAPWAVFMRALMLGTAISAIFVIVLGGVAALALLVWRALFLWIVLRKRDLHG